MSQKLIQGEVDGCEIEEREGRKNTKNIFSSLLLALPPPFPAPPPFIFSLAFQDGGRDQRTSEFPLI